MIRESVRKALDIKPSGRSSDFITPSFIHGCLYQCAYCYMRRNKPEGLSIATNVSEILEVIFNHAQSLGTKEIPNQTHSNLWTYDISCNEDFALHAKYHKWEYIFKFFKEHPKAFGSFATKYVNPTLTTFDPEFKVRIRIRLMPENISDILEPNTSEIIDRIKAIDAFIDAGYDVHINFSPVVVYHNWLEDYEYLFQMVNDYVDYKDMVKCEVIFLTHNVNKHQYNIINNIPGEELLWQPDIQEDKISQYGGKNIRYKHYLKTEFIEQFKELHDSIIPWNTIRYIF